MRKNFTKVVKNPNLYAVGKTTNNGDAKTRVCTTTVTLSQITRISGRFWTLAIEECHFNLPNVRWKCSSRQPAQYQIISESQKEDTEQEAGIARYKVVYFEK